MVPPIHDEQHPPFCPPREKNSVVLATGGQKVQNQLQNRRTLGSVEGAVELGEVNLGLLAGRESRPRSTRGIA